MLVLTTSAIHFRAEKENRFGATNYWMQSSVLHNLHLQYQAMAALMWAKFS